ncbi:galactose mutarotase-like domain-containing protein [Xylaria arbuscula]|nr:galactose mutarotase-like domain-containing protein [Xylaria arbuscula]
MRGLGSKLLALIALLRISVAFLNATETTSQFVLRNDRLYVAVDTSNGQVVDVILDTQDLLDPVSGNTGKGPYVDLNPVCIFSPVSPPSMRRDLGELRTLFRSSTELWTHLSGSDDNYAPIPSTEAYANEVTVQDATWYLGDTPEDAYVQQYSDYCTKYTLSELWHDHKVHGQYADGTTSSDGSTYGAWLVHNTRETYYGGRLHYDLMVDGIVVLMLTFSYLITSPPRTSIICL